MDGADIGATLGVVPGDVAGLGADIHVNTVRLIEQSVLDDHRRAVGDETITLHLTKPQTTLSGTAFGGLACQDLNTATRTGVDLGTDQVVQALVEDAADEDVRRVGFSRFTVNHHLTARVGEAVADETVSQAGLFFTTEGCSVNSATFHSADLATDHFQNVGDRHSGWNRVGVDNEVRHDTVGRKWHVFRFNQPSDDTFLSVPGGELVANFGNLVASDHDSNKAT